MKDWKLILWRQFGAAIQMLDNAIVACPDTAWDDGSKPPELFWYGAYHCLFYLDFYLAETDRGFAPPAPFTLSEADPSGAMPPRTYSKAELRDYLQKCRTKCRARIDALEEGDAGKRAAFQRDLSVAELLLYNVRHVQHHAAQLNLLLRHKTGVTPPPWVGSAV